MRSTCFSPVMWKRNSLATGTRPRRLVYRRRLHRHIATATEPSRLGAASVHFTPGARTAWHTHPYGQTIYVTEGQGRCQRRGGPIETIAPGDRVYVASFSSYSHIGPDVEVELFMLAPGP